MANLTYEERVALEQEKERLRRQREDERRNGMAATRANDTRVSANDDAMHGQAGRKWLGGESGAVSSGDAMHGKAGRKWLGGGDRQVQEPRSGISTFSNVDALVAQRNRARMAADRNNDQYNGTHHFEQDWGSVVAEDRAKKAADSVRQMLAEVDNADKQTRRNGEANDNIIGGLAYAAMNMPFASDGNGGYSPRELTPDTIRRIVGDNPDWQGVSRVFMRKTKVGDAEVPLLWMEKDGKMQYFSPDQAGYAANLYTGGIAAANRALKGGTRGGGGGAASPWTGGTQQGATATKGNSRDRVMLTAIQAAMKEYDGDEAAQEQYVSRMMAMYDKFAKGGEAEPQEQPQGLTDEERKAGVVMGDNGIKYANVKDMPKGVNIVMPNVQQPKPSNRNGVVDGMMGKRKPNAAPTVDEVAGSAKFRGRQEVIEYVTADGRLVVGNGYVGKDGKTVYDGTGKEIVGAKLDEAGAKKRSEMAARMNKARADEVDADGNPITREQMERMNEEEGLGKSGVGAFRAPTPNAQVAAKENKADEMLAEKKRREAAGAKKGAQKQIASTGGGQEKPKTGPQSQPQKPRKTSEELRRDNAKRTKNENDYDWLSAYFKEKGISRSNISEKIVDMSKDDLQLWNRYVNMDNSRQVKNVAGKVKRFLGKANSMIADERD